MKINTKIIISQDAQPGVLSVSKFPSCTRPSAKNFQFKFPSKLFLDRFVDANHEDDIVSRLNEFLPFTQSSEKGQVIARAKSLMEAAESIEAALKIQYPELQIRNTFTIGTYLWEAAPDDIDLITVVKGSVFKHLIIEDTQLIPSKNLNDRVLPLDVVIVGEDNLAKGVRIDHALGETYEYANHMLEIIRASIGICSFVIRGSIFEKMPFKKANTLALIYSLLDNAFLRLSNQFHRIESEKSRYSTIVSRLLVAVIFMNDLLPKGHRITLNELINLTEIFHKNYSEIAIIDKQRTADQFEIIVKAFEQSL